MTHPLTRFVTIFPLQSGVEIPSRKSILNLNHNVIINGYKILCEK